MRYTSLRKRTRELNGLGVILRNATFFFAIGLCSYNIIYWTMDVFPCVSELKENEEETRNSAVTTLLRIASNVLKKPNEAKYRTIKVSVPR